MARALSADPAPRSATLTSVLRPFAVFACVAIVMGRAIGPSAAGSGVGTSRVVDLLQRLGAVLSQAYALFGTLMLLVLVFATVRGHFSSTLRAASLSLGGLVALLVLAAAPSRASSTSLLILGTASASLALVAAWSVRRAPLAREIAPALGAVAASVLLRVFAVALLGASPEALGALAHAAARVLLLGSAALDALAVAIAALALSPRPKHGRLLRPATALAVVAAFLLARHVLLVGGEQGFVAVLVRRSITLLTTDVALGFTAARVFVTSLAVVVAIAGLIRGATTPALSATLSMLVLVRGSPNAPLAQLTLALVALATVLVANDGRALWAELDKRREASPEGQR
jgi:hypothetical protein